MADSASFRSFQRYSGPRETSFTSELALIVFTIFAGVCGLWTESVTVTGTIFGGGVLAWFAYTFPAHVRDHAQKLAPDAAAPKPAASEQPAVLQSEAVFELMASRRSIKGRDYDDVPVDRMLVERVLEAANWAPSHQLTQPWRFVVFEGASKNDLMDQTVAAAKAGPASPEKLVAILKKQDQKRVTLAKVPYLIALGMKAHAVDGVHVAESEELCATACAVQNMALMAHSLGLAGFWDSWSAARDSDDFKAYLGLLPEDKCLGVFYVGRSERAVNYRGSRGPWQDKVTWRG